MNVSDWSFLTNHARAMLFIADDPDARLRDIASALDVTERTAYGIVADLAEAGYVVKERDGRRNRYHIQDHLPLRDTISRERTIGEVLAADVNARQGRAMFVRTDVTSEIDWQNLIAKTIEIYGKLDILVNNTESPPAGSKARLLSPRP